MAIRYLHTPIHIQPAYHMYTALYAAGAIIHCLQIYSETSTCANRITKKALCGAGTVPFELQTVCLHYMT